MDCCNSGYHLGLNVGTIVNDFSMGELIIVNHGPTGNNPFRVSDEQLTVILRTKYLNLSKLSASHQNKLFRQIQGINDGVFYQLTIETPENVSDIDVGDFVALENVETIKGVIVGVDHNISGFSEIYINTSQPVPSQILNLLSQ